MDWQVFETFGQRKTSELTYLDDFFCYLYCCSQRQTKESWRGLRARHSVQCFQNTLALHW